MCLRKPEYMTDKLLYVFSFLLISHKKKYIFKIEEKCALSTLQANITICGTHFVPQTKF